MTTVNESWDGERAARWVRNAAGLERQLAPVADLLLEAAQLRRGEAVLDVGCGTGPTTRDAAIAVGPSGRVTGLDLSDDMLEVAATIQPDRAAAPLDWVQADAVTWSPGERAYDVVISRFGVMFFSDPVAAFTNLAAATRPGGRLTVSVWARRDESPLFAVPLRATLAALERLGVGREAPPDDDGPFSLHDGATVTRMLGAAGWRDVEVAEHDLALPFAGGAPPHESAVTALDFGPTRVVTAEVDGETRDAVVAAITEEFQRHVDDRGHVQLHGRVHIVTASVADPRS